MPDLEYNYTDKDFELVAETRITNDLSLYQQTGVYFRVMVIDDFTNEVFKINENKDAIFYSSIHEDSEGNPIIREILEIDSRGKNKNVIIGGNHNQFKVYIKNIEIAPNQYNVQLFIKPNDIFEENDIPSNRYQIRFDCLKQITPTHVTQEYLSTLPFPEYFEEYDYNGDGILNSIDAVGWSQQGRPDIIQKFNQSLMENPPEFAGNETPNFPSHYYNPIFNSLLNYKFIIKQISTSRKEIRVKLLNSANSDKVFPINTIDFAQPGNLIIQDITNIFNNDSGDFEFKHVINIGHGKHIPITNFQFDAITEGKDNQSLILKLYEPIPTNVNNLSNITIEQEVLTTQIENIVYFSNEEESFQVTGLNPNPIENWENYDGEDNAFETYNNLSSSLSDGTLQQLLSGSIYDYPNLNIDYNDFSNHTHFGSAKRKLENFKAKVETIQGYYSDISASLSVSSSITTDSDYIIGYRRNLFEKINDEIKTWTPYERFLYYDGQSESTASAPGLINYADTIPVQTIDYQGQINGGDGFDVVYHHSNKDRGVDQFVGLFVNKYYVHNKPFFNTSGSVYLSFLMKGDSGSALIFENRQKHFVNDLSGSGHVKFPTDSKFRENILNPDMTGSAYQRYVFHTSHSYWVPKTVDNNPLRDFALIEDFELNSSDIEILHGSTKTGSFEIRDTSGKYKNFTNVVTESGVPFKGACMPGGELFRIFYKNTLSSSLHGYWNLDSQTSGSAVTNAMLTDFSGRGNTGSIDEGTPKISDGVEVHGRQYGKSMLFLSESNDSIRYFSDNDFNFSRDDNFSLSIWVKRFHPNVANADSTTPSSANVQAIFTRGQTGNSYGIDYDFANNLVRGGVRGNSTQEQITTTATDDLLNWNHITFTYQSGSATGMKLYLNGELKGTHTTTGADYSITGSSHFSASSATIGGSTDALSIAGNDIIGGTNGHFNGFLQYPRVYDRTITAEEVQQLYLNPTGITNTKITDVKITKTDPLNYQPFSNLPHTSSIEWTNWYNGIIASAESFDNDNIHSLQNNLPTYIQEGSEHGDLKTFLALQGEQYDVIKSHIDSLGTINKRGYKKLDSPPENIYPMLLENMGYQSINPFSGSLNDSLGSYLNDITSIDDIRNNTWRKTLNNLLYVYKSKGTKNSVRALLNIYGYPPDILQIQEFGSSEGSLTDDNIISDDIPVPPNSPAPIDVNLMNTTGSVNFNINKKKLFYYMILGSKRRVLNLDWWMDDANLNTIEFVHKHTETPNTQTILESSGSGTETLWDLRLVPSSDGASSSFEFRLNNSQNGDTAIGGRGFSMSLAYAPMSDGQLWNVMLQRMTGSNQGVGTGTNEYRLHAAIHNEGSSIERYNYTSMSISGGLAGGGTAGGLGFYANQNWASTGSRHYLSSSNLFVGESYSGSITQIKGWNTALSISKFRQHTLNKFSTTGNSINSHCQELVYNFQFGENYNTSSVSSSNQMFSILDSAPKTIHSPSTADYSIQKSGSFFTSSIIYGFDFIDAVTLDNTSTVNSPTDNTIQINVTKIPVSNLSPFNNSIKSNNKKPAPNSTKLELYRSPQDFINNYFLNNIDTFNLEQYYGNPIHFYSSSYHLLDDFRDEFFDCHPIQVNVNEFIKAQENMFNKSIVEGLKTLAPVRSTLSDGKSNIGVEIKPTILERQKYEHHKNLIETNPNSGLGTINTLEFTTIDKTTYTSVKQGEVFKPVSTSGSLDLPLTSSISFGNAYVTSSGYLRNVPFKNHNQIPFLQPDGYVTTIVNPYIGSISMLPSYDGSTIVIPPTGSIDFASDRNKSFVNIHDSWGRGTNDTHFINLAGGTGSNNDYNIGHIDTRFVFHMIGDTEIYSGSRQGNGSFNYSDFSNPHRLHNRKIVSNDVHSNVTYESLINGNLGIQTGRMIGKTRYFLTSSDGTTITLPSNHVSKFSQPFKEKMIQGTQNTNPGFLNVRYEDYSTSSFYRVKVTGGENQIIVKGNTNPSIDKDTDRIMYN